MSEWISVKEKKPKIGKMAIVGCELFSNKNFSMCFGAWDGERFVIPDDAFGWTELNSYEDEPPRENFNDNEDDMKKVTHWMPLPEPPKGE